MHDDVCTWCRCSCTALREPLSVHEGILARSLFLRLARGVRSDVFYVLVGAVMPAILVEASFMTRPDELAALKTEHYRQTLADGIVNGVVQYVESR